MAWIAGVDGCKAGWIVVLRDIESGQVVRRLATRLAEVLAWPEDPEVIAIDMPIGLLDAARRGGRGCDKAARRLLGKPRSSSVFSPPVRAALKARTFAEGARLNRASSPDRIGITQQCFNITPKIREVDELVTPALQGRIVEVHPEVSFFALNGSRSIVAKKKSAAGLIARVSCLEIAWRLPLEALIQQRPKRVGKDDIVDALAACWTAERIHAGRAATIPAQVERDSRGLRMEIVR